jgi:osmotically-inducible protein OsmY
MHGAPFEGGHRGQGPKNYWRSDQRIWEEVGEELTESDAVDARELEVHVDHAEVTLDGVVPTQLMKELAEQTAASVAGVRCVSNRLRTKDVVI